MQHVMIIPTNRDAEPSLRSASAEVRFAATRQVDMPLMVIETNRDRCVKRNAEVLREVSRANHHSAVHLTLERQRALFDAALGHTESEWHDLFLNGTQDYGTAMNKCFLYSASIGAEFVHRRDSDTVTLDREYPEQKNRLPIAHELDMLGSEIPAEGGRGSTPIIVVGGNYVGEWNLDVKDVVAAHGDRSVLSSLYELLGFDRDSISEMIAEAFPEELSIPESGVRTIVRSVNEGLNPDCGNVAFCKIQSVLPTVPGPNILAADYFAFDAATSLGLPSVHHSDAVFHAYSPSRLEHSAKLSYWEGLARFADYFNVYGPLYDGTLAKVLGIPPGTLPTDEASRTRLAGIIDGLAGRDRSERIERIRALARNVLSPLGGVWESIGDHLASHAPRFIDECDASYRIHARLIDEWPRLIEKFQRYDVELVN